MIALRRASVLAADAASVSGGRASRGLTGGLAVASAARVGWNSPVSPEPLPAAELDALGSALREVAGAAGVRATRATVLLPDYAGALLVLDRERGVDLVEHARFRLAASLDAAVADLVARVAPAPGGRLLAIALRRDTLVSYQAAIAAAGLASAAISFAAFAALAALPAASAPVTVDLVLGDAAGTLFGWNGGRLASARCRLRDPGADDAPRWHAEIRRTAALLGAEPGRVRVLGPGAARLGAALVGLGLQVRVGLPRLQVDVPGVAGEDLLWPAALA